MNYVNNVPEVKVDGAVASQSLQSASGFIDSSGAITSERHTPLISSIAWDSVASRMTVVFANPYNEGFPYRSSLDIYDGDANSPTYGGLIGILRPLSANPTTLVLWIVDQTVIPAARVSFSLVIVGT